MALTKTPIELSSTPSIVDGGNATAITIDSSENVGIGVSNPSDYYAADLVVTGPSEGGITIASTGNHTNYLLFADSTSGVARYAGMVEYAHTIDAMSFRTNSIQRMRIDSSGRVTMPYQPAFQVVPPVNQNNIPINANTTVNFSSEVFDQGSNYAGTSFTAPVTGKYQLNLSLYTLSPDSASDYIQVSIKTSNRQYYAIIDPSIFTGDPTYWSFAITVLADMDASDTAHVEVQLNNTGAAQITVTANSTFSGYLVA